jgi:hypothetical protein
MVCAKCQKLSKPTSLATPEVKKKSEIYYGSPLSSSKNGAKSSPTLGNTGIGKVRLQLSNKPPNAVLIYLCRINCYLNPPRTHMQLIRKSVPALNAAQRLSRAASTVRHVLIELMVRH